jgi:hypothetical protein
VWRNIHRVSGFAGLGINRIGGWKWESPYSFGIFTSSIINRFQAAYRGFVTGGDVSSGFGPDCEALVSPPPNYDALNQYDIVSTLMQFYYYHFSWLWFSITPSHS